MAAHSVTDCPQNPTLDNIQATLKRLDKHGERTAIALESIAAQGVMLEAHEKRLDKHGEYIEEAFKRLRTIENSRAVEHGKDIVEKKNSRFWDTVKQKLTPFAVGGLFFLLWLIDRFNIAQKFIRLWNEFKK